MYANRERLEQIEIDTLAPYAIRSRTSAGRAYPENEPRYRTAFQRDRDRIVHSAAFRRLEYKTQVFVNDEGDYYRTRLTHTLEVAQIGRTMARALGVNEDLVEAICLAHDLGHAPFGHAGENVLNALLQGHGGFNHNMQSYRIVTQLEQRYPGNPGLNLTRETLAGLAKHETNYDLSDFAGLDPTVRGSVEAQLADKSDEVAYNAHDLDDGLRSGLLTADDLRGLEIWQRLCDQVGWQEVVKVSEVSRHTIVRELVGMQVDDLLGQTSRNLEMLQPESSETVQRHHENVVAHTPDMQIGVGALKQFLYDNMYRHFRVVRMAKRAERFISEIFASLTAESQQLPPEYQAQLKGRALERVVADYIAGMTDRSALLEYRRLYDPLMRP
jgi:dGTPase